MRSLRAMHESVHVRRWTTLLEHSTLMSGRREKSCVGACVGVEMSHNKLYIEVE